MVTSGSLWRGKCGLACIYYLEFFCVLCVLCVCPCYMLRRAVCRIIHPFSRFAQGTFPIARASLAASVILGQSTDCATLPTDMHLYLACNAHARVTFMQIRGNERLSTEFASLALTGKRSLPTSATLTHCQRRRQQGITLPDCVHRCLWASLSGSRYRSAEPSSA
jgi:hypothetical protein